MSDPSPCDVCGRDRTRDRRGETTGAAGAVTVTFPSVPVLVCAAGHTRVAGDDLAGEVAGALQSTALVARRGWPWGPERCASCGTGLTMPPRRTLRSVRVTLDVDADAEAEVEPTFALPMIRCPSCAREQLPRAHRPA